MNFLQLAETLRLEVGVTGGALTSVDGLPQQQARLVRYIADAWDEIQLLHADWSFMIGSFAFETEARFFRYNAPRDAGLDDLREWDEASFLIYPKTTGITAQVPLPAMRWDDFRLLYQAGISIPANPDLYTYTLGQVLASTSAPTVVISSYDDWVDSYAVVDARLGRPATFAVRPDNDLVLSPAPDDAYVITGNYWREHKRLTLAADTPTMPERYHRAIVALAKVKYGEYMNAPEAYAAGMREWSNQQARLEIDQRPVVRMASWG